jgi:hypothetical protein
MHIDNDRQSRPGDLAASAVQPAYWRKSGLPHGKIVADDVILQSSLPISDRGRDTGFYAPLGPLVQE